MSADPRLIAFYLPQFHPIPENDRWWGRGFTEWTNVASARPLFEGHVQPHLPSELGFYDLRLPEVRQAQADLAREHGIHGFCYYHYWFNGRLLLERPFNEVLASGRPDFPFCLCWANENWTRSWDGLDGEVLIAQKYGPDDDRRHMRWLIAAFADERYIRVDGKPLLLVYRIAQVPNAFHMASIWREEARRHGIGEIFLATIESLREDRVDPTRLGFDAAVEFQPDWLNLGAPWYSDSNGNEVYPYEKLVEGALQKPRAPYRRFRCVTPGWDNTARRRRDARVFAGSTPALYQRWLEGIIERERNLDHGPIVFINAWNEWAEGAFLEPSQAWGAQYLEATRRALRTTRSRVDATRSVAGAPAVIAAPQVKISVCIPTFNGAAYLQEAVQSVISQTFDDFELLIVDDCSSDASAVIADSFVDRRVRRFRNRTRLGLIGNWNHCLQLARGEYVSVFHQDDVMLPQNLGEKATFLDEHASAGFVHSNVRQIGSDGEVLSNWWYSKPGADEGGLCRGYACFERLLLGPNIISCPSVLARRKIFQEIGAFDSTLPFTADWEMWMRAALFFDVGYLVKPLVHYRRHSGNETNNFMGPKEIQHAYEAKMRILSRNAERIVEVEKLTILVSESSRDDALTRGRECRRRGDWNDAVRYLELAVDIQGCLASSPREYTDWFLRVLTEWCHAGPAFDRVQPLQDAQSELVWLRERLRSPRHRIAEALGNAIQKTPVLWPAVQKLTDTVLHWEKRRGNNRRFAPEKH